VNWGAVHRVRVGHVRELLKDRYRGYEVPDDDAGNEDLRIFLHVKASANRPEQREKVLFETARLWAPWMSAEEARQVAAEIAAKPLKVTSTWLGQQLNVDSATRDRLGIWQIGATDMDAEARKARRRERDRERKRELRNRQPRAEYLAEVTKNSKQSTKPWVMMGISRATYFRRQSKGIETGAVHGDETGSVSPHQSNGVETRCVDTPREIETRCVRKVPSLNRRHTESHEGACQHRGV
jgi:hypothetical protein